MSTCPDPIHLSFASGLSSSPGWREALAKIAEDLGISESCLHNWMKQADIDDGTRDGSRPTNTPSSWLFAASCASPKMEIEILKRAAAYFARDHALPK